MEYGRKFLYGMEDFSYGMEIEWKKITSMEYGKIIFHSIPYYTMPCELYDSLAYYPILLA